MRQFLNAELTAEERAVVEWTGLRNCSTKETAAALRLPEETVRTSEAASGWQVNFLFPAGNS